MPFGSILSSIPWGDVLKVAEIGMAGAGTIGNIATEKARSDELGYLKGQQKAIPDATTLSKEVAAATQPLNTGLVQGVENQVSGSLAEQGLSQAPGIQAAVLSQALAPYVQQNQQTALQLVMQRLGLPLSYASTYLGGLPNNSNISPLLALLSKSFGTPSPSTPTSPFNYWAATNAQPRVPPPQTYDTASAPDVFNLLSTPSSPYADAGSSSGGLF
jgi:hypothetical protein